MDKKTVGGITLAKNAQKAKRKRYVRARLLQIAIGILFLFFTAIILCLAYSGKTVEDKDATGIIVTLPIALYCIFTKNIFI